MQKLKKACTLDSNRCSNTVKKHTALNFSVFMRFFFGGFPSDHIFVTTTIKGSGMQISFRELCEQIKTVAQYKPNISITIPSHTDVVPFPSSVLYRETFPKQLLQCNSILDALHFETCHLVTASSGPVSQFRSLRKHC